MLLSVLHLELQTINRRCSYQGLLLVESAD